MKFLINPECYHKMCSSCVDRLFTAGPAPCPIIGCHRTLRKRNFKEAFFEDLTIERESDIRGKVIAVFNKKEGDFATLRDWNDYLEQVETLIFDLTEGNEKERAAAEKKLEGYSKGHKKEIEENKKENERIRIAEKEAQLKAEADKREKRLEAARIDMEEKADLEKSKREVLDRLANNDGDAEAITQQAQRVILKKSSARRSALTNSNANTDSRSERVVTRGGSSSGAMDSEDTGGFVIRGLKKKPVAVVEGPYDPFAGLDMKMKPTMFVLQDDYEYDWLKDAKTNPLHTTGGYDLQEYYKRTMFEAFSGLGVFIEDEVGQRESAVQKAQEVVADKMDLDDVF